MGELPAWRTPLEAIMALGAAIEAGLRLVTSVPAPFG